jgi:predicted AAA+ superfamily ATPase
MIRDWMLGECAASGRDRAALVAVLDVLLVKGGSPVGQSLLAREAGLANNTVAAGYLELLADLMCFGYGHAWDASRSKVIRRKPAKSPAISLLAAVAWDRARLRSPADFATQPLPAQGRYLEWLVAQEVWRRAAIRGEPFPEILPFWEGGGHEIDFVVHPDLLVEVKRGRTGPMEFTWFPCTFPGARLIVVGQDRFEGERVRGVTAEDLLLSADWTD